MNELTMYVDDVIIILCKNSYNYNILSLSHSFTHIEFSSLLFGDIYSLSYGGVSWLLGLTTVITNIKVLFFIIFIYTVSHVPYITYRHILSVEITLLAIAFCIMLNCNAYIYTSSFDSLYRVLWFIRKRPAKGWQDMRNGSRGWSCTLTVS